MSGSRNEVASFLLALVLLVGCGTAIDPGGLPAEEEEAFGWLAEALVAYRSVGNGEELLDGKQVDSLHSALLRIRKHEGKDWPEMADWFAGSVVRAGEELRRKTRLIHVDLTESSSWREVWLAGEIRTGDPGVDALIAQYELVPERASVFREESWHLVGPSPFNPPTLADRIARLDDVAVASPDSGWDLYHWSRWNFLHVDDRISVRADRPFGGGWRVRIGLGSGDCPRGCLNVRRWTFHSGAGGRVRLVRQKD